MTWQALLPKTLSALLSLRKIPPSAQVTGNTFPITRPPLGFTCYAVNVICIAVVRREPSFRHGCPVQDTLLPQEGGVNPFTVLQLKL